MDKLLYDIKSLIFGFAIGDAMGVPFEFMSNQEILDTEKSLLTYNGYMSHNQKSGTWSDDTSMTLALIDAELNGSGSSIDNYLKWFTNGDYAINNEVFDIGNQTYDVLFRNLNSQSLERFNDKKYNGNGGLMRILPMVLFTLNKSDSDKFKMISDEVKITHPHFISIFCCVFMVEFVQQLYLNKSANISPDYNKIHSDVINKITNFYPNFNEFKEITPILEGTFFNKSLVCGDNNGFVVNTVIEVLNNIIYHSNDYKGLVKNAIINGDDTDTIAALCGGIFGVINGFDELPTELVDDLLGVNIINDILLKKIN